MRRYWVSATIIYYIVWFLFCTSSTFFTLYLSIVPCMLFTVANLSKKHVCMFVSPKWETNHHFHCCCVSTIDAKMHYCRNFHWLVFCFIFLWLHILIGWHILFAVSGDTKPTTSTITCMSRIHIHLSIWISSNCIFTSFALSSSIALSGTHKSEHFHST